MRWCVGSARSTEARDFAVDGDATRADELLARAARAEPGTREQLLQPFRLGRRSAPRHSGAVASLAGSSTLGSSVRWSPRSSASTIDASGTKSPSDGRSASESRPEPFEERGGGAVEHRVAGPGVAADFLHVAALLERVQRRLDVHATDRRDLPARDRLLVRDDRERLQRRRRQPRRAGRRARTARRTAARSGCVW